MPEWFPLQVPLNRGLSQHVAENGFDRNDGLTSGINLDFGTKGAVRGRPGWTRRSGYTKRALDVNANVDYSSVATKALTGYSGFKAASVLDAFGARGALVSRGRIYVDDKQVWQDRGGCCPMEAKRLVSYPASVGDAPGTSGNDWQNAPINWAGCGYDFGLLGRSALGNQWVLLNEDNQPAGRASDSAVAAGFMATARIGAVSAGVMIASGGLYLVLHTAGTDTITSTILSAVPRFNTSGAALTDVGTMCCICADYDAAVFYVAFWVDPTSAVDTYRVLRVDTTGAILTTASFATGTTALTTTQPALWITNTDAATNRLVVAEHTASGVKTKILNATSLADVVLDVTLTANVCTSMSPSIVCGAAENGEVWVAFTAQVPLLGDQLFIYKRSLTAATSRLYNQWGWERKTNATKPGHVVRLHHQPISVGGRILLGLSTITGTEGTAPANSCNTAATWTVVDITDLWATGVSTGATSGNLVEPVCVASGTLEGSAFAASPFTAVLESSTAYRFGSLDWLQIESAASATVGDNTFVSGRVGFSGQLGMNRVTFLNPQYAQFQQTTLIAGSVPRALAGGDVHPVNFPWGAGASINAIGQTGAGSLVVGDSFTLQAIWVWYDEQQKLHRSAPSTAWTVLISGGFSKKLDVDVQAPHFAERLAGTIYVELYMTQANPTGAAALYLVGTQAYGGSSVQSTSFEVFGEPDGTSAPLYTGGGVLSCQRPSAQGGVATVRNRCWMADGSFVYASRLGDEQAANEAPSWHIDDTLRLRVGSPGSSIVGLAELGDNLAIFTQDSIYLTTGDGPDDTGLGQNFREPVRMADVGALAQRAIASTPVGVVFQAAYTLADGTPETGGLFVLGSGFQVEQVSAPVRNEVTDNVAGDVIFNPVRDILYWSRPTNGDLLVFDKRAQAWSKWTVEATVTNLSGVILTNSDPFVSFSVAGGVLHGVADEPAKLLGTTGTDTLTQTASYPMSLRLNQVAVARDQGGWGRCRSIQLVQDKAETAEPYNVTVDVYDGGEQIGHVVHTSLTGLEQPTESFLDKQKASTVDVVLSVNKAIIAWTGMVLQVKGLMRTKQGPRNYQ
jgi:hypothetical protein